MYSSDKTIVQYLKERVCIQPLDIAIKGENEIISWTDLDELSTLLAKSLIQRGVKEREHIGILSTNSANWIILFFAILKVNAVPVLFNSVLSKGELADLVNYSDAKYVFYCIDCDKVNVKKSVEYLKLNTQSDFIRIPLENYNREHFKESEVVNTELNYNNAKSEDVALIMFTSGTTQSAKGVLLSHLNILKNAYTVCKSMKWTKNDRLLVSVPLFHCFGTSICLLTSLFSGHQLVIAKSFHRENTLRYIQNYQITVLNGVPSMFLALVKFKDFDKYNTSSLRNGIIAGSFFSQENYIEIVSKFKNLDLISSYGQTETAPCVTLTDLDDNFEDKSLYQGKVIDDVLIKISDSQEILVKGYNTTLGYYKLENDTKNLYNEEGYLKTGDLGLLNEKGQLSIIGRKKDLIIRAGENISPSEIEKFILTYDGIVECKVIGKKAPVIQEMVVACIVTIKDINLNNLKEYLKNYLTKYKIPEEYYIFDELPKTASGKISVKELKEKVDNEK